jgi:hypothetical protein
MTQIAWQGLVHDIIEHNENTEGAETGCGLILRATPDKLTDSPTNCFQCITGEFEFMRELNSIEALKAGYDPDGVYADMLKKRRAKHQGGT